MNQTRRTFLRTAAAAAGSITVIPFAASAGGHSPHEFPVNGGVVTVNPVHHASIVLETPMGVLYIDPVGEASEYADLPAPDAILITHQHGDHYNADLLAAIKTAEIPMVVNPAVFDMLTDDLKANTTAIANGEAGELLGIAIDAIPAYNMDPEKQNFHPQGRDNGYVLTMGDFRVYVSGDTEDIPEMRALTEIDLAFVCMNLPFTMSAEAAADAVREFRPANVYPYHYRGRDGGTQDPAKFAELVGDAATVKMGDWYKPGELG
ncbi:MBL fold metallo-hydrolase [Thetidibacter halocola]|uniref:MBL fold metallo-hydrolase n=1 Tax=Thetidibacter halocola TaxID=2827239 RepID=A0A8J7WFI9_9RHOB|nr:MBL fold metallo-hydrolase [Thetidibacter halocola]MBS0125877.1 MBL fold metallo-hydrolase [Thetidibacter halocola]